MTVKRINESNKKIIIYLSSGSELCNTFTIQYESVGFVFGNISSASMEIKWMMTVSFNKQANQIKVTKSRQKSENHTANMHNIHTLVRYTHAKCTTFDRTTDERKKERKGDDKIFIIICIHHFYFLYSLFIYKLQKCYRQKISIFCVRRKQTNETDTLMFGACKEGCDIWPKRKLHKTMEQNSALSFVLLSILGVKS